MAGIWLIIGLLNGYVVTGYLQKRGWTKGNQLLGSIASFMFIWAGYVLVVAINQGKL